MLRREAGKEESVRELRVTVERLTARLEEVHPYYLRRGGGQSKVDTPGKRSESERVAKR